MADPENMGKQREDVGYKKPPKSGQFKAGNPGRPKGSRNALGEAFLSAMHEDFKQHGALAIEEVRQTKPDQYLKVVASILPKELNVNVNEFEEMTDDQLIERIRQLDAITRPFLDGTSPVIEGTRSETAH